MSLKFEVINPKLAGLAGSFTVNPDSCENPLFYEMYLRFIAYTDLCSGENTTHVLYDDESNEIHGFISLRASAVISAENVTKGEPAIEISVLAVAQNHERQGIGRLLVDYAVSEADRLHKEIFGVKNLVLVADHKAVGFYEKYGFSVIGDYKEIPRVNWNKECVPMILPLAFDLGPTYASEDDDEWEF